MATAGIVAEYNPFHWGHAWHIARTRRTLGADTAVVCVMSGHWVQRGECAVTDKWRRAALALAGGADLVLEMPEFEPHYLIVVDRVNNTDTFQIQVEVRPDYYSDEMNKMIALKKKIAARMQSVIGIQPDIKIVEPRSLERSMGKAKHVIDNRKLV